MFYIVTFYPESTNYLWSEPMTEEAARARYKAEISEEGISPDVRIVLYYTRRPKSLEGWQIAGWPTGKEIARNNL